MGSELHNFLSRKNQIVRSGSQGLTVMDCRHEDNFKRDTAPFDARFPNTNQTKNCWQNYADFRRCQRIKGEDYEPCRYFQRAYMSLCQNSSIEKWDDLFDKGAFPSVR